MPRKRAEASDQSGSNVVPISPDMGEHPPPTIEDLFPEECAQHVHTDTGEPLAVISSDMKSSDMVRDVAAVVVGENRNRLATGGFHPGLLFRHGESDELVTLARTDTGRVVIKPLTKAALTIVVQEWFCYLNGKQKHVNMPSSFLDMLMVQVGYDIPVLSGLLQHPAVHLDGTYRSTEGYDPETRCWVVDGWDDLVVPTKPTKGQITAAVATLREPFVEVIFKGDSMVGADPVKEPGTMTASEANVLGMILTGLLRGQMETAPYFIVTSAQWGTAKGLIASVMSNIVQGRDPLVTAIKASGDQSEKNIDRVLIDHPGSRIVQFDEPQETGSNNRLHSRQLALLATTDNYVTRAVFGRKAVKVDTRRLFVFTGNSIQPDKDIVRRVSLIELDIPHDGTLPHERTFKVHADKVSLIRFVQQHRERYMTAALTLVQAWRLAGCPEADFQFDFPEWVHTVGGILQHAGVTTWMENRNEVYRNADEALRCNFVLALHALVGAGPISSRELVRQMVSAPHPNDLKDLLTWSDPWAKNLYSAWSRGNEDEMTLHLGHLLGGVKDRLMSNGNSGRVTVATHTGHKRIVSWVFTIPGQTVAPVQRKVGRPRK